MKLKVDRATTTQVFDIINFEQNLMKLNAKDPGNESDAVITHFLLNLKHSSEETYKDNALQLIAAMTNSTGKNPYQLEELTALMSKEMEKVPFPPPAAPKFTFIDLFAGIGGFRLAMQGLGGKCVFTSEWDKNAKITYLKNYGEVPFGDITNPIIKAFIPKQFDLLCAGFPCQAFSIAGKRGGFEDTRGTLFFDVAEIIRTRNPKVIFLENVKGLRNHDQGKTLATILNVLREDLGYDVPEPQIVNAKDFGVPQNRERIYIVGFKKELNVSSFQYPVPFEEKVVFGDIKEEDVVPTRFYLSQRYLTTLYNHRARHEGKGNGFGFQIINDNEIANAIVVGGMGRERNLVHDDRIVDYTATTHIKGEVNREGIRKMTPREWARLQGFPEEFKIEVSDSSAYKQFGNSVAVPAIKATGEKLLQAAGLI